MKYLFVLLVICVLPFSCKKDKAFMNNAVITGVDARLCACVLECPCCGGFFFHFTDNGDTTDVRLDNPEIFNLPPNTKFPVRVQVDWENTTRCGVKAAKINAYKIL